MPHRRTSKFNLLQLVWNLQQQWVRNNCTTVRNITPCPLLPIGCLFVLSVEELAKKRGVKMAQIAVAWSLKRVTAPIAGTSKIQNLKETIGK